MDALETQLVLEQTKVKSPGFAAILAFFFPVFGALYVRRIGLAILFLVIDFFNLILAIVGIGILLALLFRLIAGYLAYSWAHRINQSKLAEVIAARKG